MLICAFSSLSHLSSQVSEEGTCASFGKQVVYLWPEIARIVVIVIVIPFDL